MEENSDGWQQLLAWCTHVKDEEQLSSLFELLLTHEERVDIAKRCLIIRELLAKKFSQRDIAKNLNVSIAKITRGSNEIKRLSPEILKFIQENSK